MKNIASLILLVSLTACGTVQKAQYSAYEKVGVHKRDILVERIEKTSKQQEKTKVEFKSAYEELSSLVASDNSKLETKYKRLSKSVAASEYSAEALKDRIDSVDQVANALFAEWNEELKEYTNPKLRNISAKNLRDTQTRYATIYSQMRNSHAKIDPVLKVLQDNTLYLKHNLNARAISGISNEVLSVEGKVSALIQQMEASIEESKSFIQAMTNK